MFISVDFMVVVHAAVSRVFLVRSPSMVGTENHAIAHKTRSASFCLSTEAMLVMLMPVLVLVLPLPLLLLL